MRIALYTLVTAVVLLVAAPDAAAQPAGGVIAGIVVDAATGEPLPGAAVRLRELERGKATDLDGRFRFEAVPARATTLAVRFLGYLPLEQRVQVAPGEIVHVTLALEASALDLPGLVVTGTTRERGVAETYQPTAVLAGRELQRALAPSLAETLQDVPGLHAAYNGPAASQPTIRGMGGDRVLILEDGQRTGDLATTAADHAVSLDPLSAERIEVVRGPAGLLYGSNALGGVINVWRGDVPRARPDRLGGTVTSTAESVNRSAGGQLTLSAPAGPLAVRVEAGGRRAGDTRTPAGTLPSSDLATVSAAAGASLVGGWGFAGAAYRFFDTTYGVPGTFNGETIPGAHEGGVEIAMRRHVLRFEAAHLAGFGPIETLEADGHLTRYLHDEIEDHSGGEPHYGARFAQTSADLALTARHSHALGAFTTEGALGLSGFGRDLSVRGGYTGTRAATEAGGAAFVYEEFGRAPLRFQLGARYDLRRIAPTDGRPIRLRDREVPVRARTFGAASASAALLLDARPGWTLGLSVARAFRSPAPEELYSDGPHLADYSFNVGNPDLDPEIGHGADLFVRVTRPRLSFDVAAFVNRIDGYIYYRPTGELDYRERRFPVFQATGDDALFLGFEGRAQAEVLPRLVLDAAAGYVRATRSGDPLPAIPPLSGRVEARYEVGPLSAALGWSAAARQHRVPAAVPSPLDPDVLIRPERPTDGYGLLHASLGLRFERLGAVHTLALHAHNLTDAEWRDHLSRIKEVAPQPGRNLRLTSRAAF